MIKELEFLLSPLSLLKGYNEKVLNTYKRLLCSPRIFDQNKNLKVIDLLYHKPEKVLYRRQNPNLMTVQSGDFITVEVTVDNYEKPFKSSQPHRIRCFNNTGFLTIIFFKIFPDFISKNFKEGNKILVSGKVERFNNELQMSHPDYINSKNIPLFEQVYPLTFGLTNRILRQNIQNILLQINDLPEWIDNNFLFQYQWKSWKESLIALHNAEKEEDLSKNSIYVERLAFDEILANQIVLGIMREKVKMNGSKSQLENKNSHLKKIFLNNLPFELTNDQKNVITEIERDIYSDKRMLRLLQGDVGSGKTVVAFLTMLSFIENMKQVAFMVPTSILATQHYEWIKKIFEKAGFDVEFEISNKKKDNSNFDFIDHGISVNNLDEKNKNQKPIIKLALLTGKVKGKKRHKILEGLKSGEINILIGTHAIFQEDVEFRNLAYAIIDEQHRFGVSQRLNLIEKGDNIDVLIMTATPIPRTLSLTIYGDMEVSSIKEKPKNRKEIITSSLQKEKFEELIMRIKQKILDGEKVYWICPLIDENENLQLTPLFQRFEELKAYFNENELGFIHGKLTEDKKDKIMEEFEKSDGTIKILIATTVIEVGIDIPDATIIIIENPERFGLSQMHQLRGRVGRGDKQSYCILFYEKLTLNLKKRMSILKNSSDGFLIAEEDLKMRGSGELLGLKQSGYQEYLIANLSEHYNLLLEASKMARYIVNNKEILSSKPTRILLEMFGYENCLNEAILN